MLPAARHCAKCEKDVAITTCIGCNLSLCNEHYVIYRQDLFEKFQTIVEQHDALQQELVEDESSHPLFFRISQWENDAIRQIQIAAETARNNLREGLDRTMENSKTCLQKIKDGLRAIQDSKNFTEIDLQRWSSELTTVRKAYEEFPLVKISEDLSSILRFNQVSEQK